MIKLPKTARRTVPKRLECQLCGYVQTIRRLGHRNRPAGHIKHLYCPCCLLLAPHEELPEDWRSADEVDQLEFPEIPDEVGEKASAYEVAIDAQRRLRYRFFHLGLPQSAITMAGNAIVGYRFEVKFQSEVERALANLGDEYDGIPLIVEVVGPIKPR